MNAVCSLFNDLTSYILKRLEFSPETVFTQGELERIAPDDFLHFKQQKYLVGEYRDIERTTYIDADGVRRFVRNIKGQYWGYSQDSDSPGRVLIAPEELQYYKFDLMKFAEVLKEQNWLLGKTEFIGERLLFIGAKDRTGVFIGLFSDDRQASFELLSLRSRSSFADQMLVLCPTYECPQAVLRELNHQKIDCCSFQCILDDNGTLRNQANEQSDITTLTFLDEKSGGRSYFVTLNDEKLSVPYAELVLLIYFVMKLKDGAGWINKEMTDLEGITDPDVESNINHLYHLVGKLIKSLRQRHDLIQNDKEGNYRLNIPLENISYQSEQWLNDRFTEILMSLEKTRERRAKQKKIRLKTK